MNSSRSRRGRVWLLLAAVLLTALPLRADEPVTPSPQEDWIAMAFQGQRIGYGRQLVSERVENGRTIIRTELHMHSVLKRFDTKMTFIIDQTTDETADGELLSTHYRVDNPPASRMETDVRVDGAKVLVDLKSGEQVISRELKRPDGLKSPSYLERMIETSPPEVGESIQFQTFEPQLNSFLTLKLTNEGPAEFTVPGQEKQSGQRLKLEYLDGIPGLTAHLYLDADGKSRMTDTPLLGMAMWRVTREEALQEIPADVDLGMAAIIRVKGMKDSHRSQELICRVASKEALSASRFPQSETQSVKQVDDTTVELTIRSVTPKSAATLLPGKDTDVQPADLGASSFAAIHDEKIIDLANTAAPADASPAAIAAACERTVYDWLDQKNMSSNLATASEVVRSREGDCTEHAVLLTALLRVRKIPARVAVGVVYVDELQALVGHAWTEAHLNGRWIPLDATLAKGGIGCGHIKLAESSLEDGDAALIAGSIAVWHLINDAQLEVVRLVPMAQ